MTSVRLQATVALVKIRNFIHKGLKRLYIEDVAKGVPPQKKCVHFLRGRCINLTGDRKGTWSLKAVSQLLWPL